jgi:phosphatidylglycerol:prolipoprotein diacylglycerol transferase
MHPILFQFMDFTVYSYGCMIAVGMIFGTLLIARQLQKSVGDFEFLPTWIFLMMLSSFFGARGLHAFYFPDLFWQNPLQFILFGGGLVWYGGFIGGLMAFLLLAYRSRHSFWQLVDAFLPGVLLGLAFGRVGCFLSGCCYGTLCQIQGLAVQFPIHHPSVGQEVHPVQLYESMGAFLLMLVMLMPMSSYQRGRNAVIFCIGYGLLRFGLEFLRGDKLIVQDTLSASQWISLFFVLLGILLWIYLKIQTQNKDSKS